MLYMISSQSVTDGVSLSVSTSKLVYRKLLFLDNKLTLIRQLTQQQLEQFLSVIHELFYLSGKFCIFEDKSLRRIGYIIVSYGMTQSAILPVT